MKVEAEGSWCWNVTSWISTVGAIIFNLCRHQAIICSLLACFSLLQYYLCISIWMLCMWISVETGGRVALTWTATQLVLLCAAFLQPPQKNATEKETDHPHIQSIPPHFAAYLGSDARKKKSHVFQLHWGNPKLFRPNRMCYSTGIFCPSRVSSQLYWKYLHKWVRQRHLDQVHELL